MDKYGVNDTLTRYLGCVVTHDIVKRGCAIDVIVFVNDIEIYVCTTLTNNCRIARRKTAEQVKIMFEKGEFR